MSQKRKRENDGLRLTDKRHPGLGILSTVLAGISLVIFCGVCLLSGQNRGNLGLSAGVLGLVCFGISVAGFICAWVSLHLENIRTLFPTIGSMANGLMVVMYLILYAWGTSL